MFTSVAVLEQAFNRLGLEGRFLVTTYGELKAFARIPTGEAVDPEQLQEQLSQALQRAERQLDMERKLSVSPDPGELADTIIRGLDRPLVPLEWLTDQDLKDPYYRDLFAGPILQLAPHLRLGGWFPGAESKKLSENLPPIVTFYSFKGGVGRSTALALCALRLAQLGHKVAVIDMDLEAPGVAAQLLVPPEMLPRKGVVDYLFEKAIRREELTRSDVALRYVAAVSSRLTQSGKVWVVPAGTMDEFYPEKLSRVDIDLLEMRKYNPFRELFGDLTEALHPDVILVDSRTGIAEVGGALLFNYSTAVVNLLRGDAQSRQGAEVLLSRFASVRPERRPDLIWVHAMLTRPPGQDADYHAETEEFIKSAYERWGAYREDDSANTNQELEYFLHPIRRLELLENLTEEILLNPLVYTDYLPLIDRIKSYLPRAADTSVSRTAPVDSKERAAYLDEIEKGFAIGYSELEKFEDVDYFRRNFLVIPTLRDTLADPKFLITGAKGVGKSALYLVLQRHAPLVDPDGSEERRHFVKGHGDPRERRGGDWLYSAEDFQRLEQLRKEAESRGKETEVSLFWKRLWSAYAYLRLFQQFGTELEGQEWWRLAKELDESTNSSKHLERLFPLLTEYELAWEVEKALDAIHEQFAAKGQKIVLLYDHLDKGFEGNVELRRVAATGLLIFWQARIRRTNFLLAKIFLRLDIWNSLNFANKTHLDPHRVEIKWTKEDLHRLILKRAISASERLRELYEQRGLLSAVEKTESGLDIPADPAVLEPMVNLLFGERIRSGKGKLYNWFENRLRDAHGNLYPRSAISLIHRACKEARRYPLDQTAIIPGAALTNVLPDVSKDRVQQLREEYEQLEPLFAMLEKRRDSGKTWRVPIDASQLEDFIQNVLSNELKDFHRTVQQIIDDLLAVGVLEKRVQKDGLRYTLPDLYLTGLGALRMGPR